MATDEEEIDKIIAALDEELDKRTTPELLDDLAEDPEVLTAVLIKLFERGALYMAIERCPECKDYIIDVYNSWREVKETVARMTDAEVQELLKIGR